jgi:hypothetical protein
MIEIVRGARGPRVARRTTPEVGPDDLVIWHADDAFTLVFSNAGSPGKDRGRNNKERLEYASDERNEVRLHMRELAGAGKKTFNYSIMAWDGELDPAIIIDPGKQAQIR